MEVSRASSVQQETFSQICIPNLERLDLAFAVGESRDGVKNRCDPFEPWTAASGLHNLGVPSRLGKVLVSKANILH